MPNEEKYTEFLRGTCIYYPRSLKTSEFREYARRIIPGFVEIYRITDVVKLWDLYYYLFSRKYKGTAIDKCAANALVYGHSASRAAIALYVNYIREEKLATNDDKRVFRSNTLDLYKPSIKF